MNSSINSYYVSKYLDLKINLKMAIFASVPLLIIYITYSNKHFRCVYDAW